MLHRRLTCFRHVTTTDFRGTGIRHALLILLLVNPQIIFNLVHLWIYVLNCILMFTKGSEIGRHLGLFGSVFFDAHETSSGFIMVGFGLQNPWILTLIFLVLFVFSLVFFIILSALQKRKKMLEALSKNKI
ncbi:hypothetical protein CYJ66_06390 [Gardnerella vaginalis]|nr:hypothetical protein CYJ66_06390 [Gardnerella vaginalis]PKZ56457.1 hypothetical protein CYJ64_06390 [Gardnerella vaginalis]